MKNYWPDFCIIFVATFLLAACKPDLEKELCKAESLSAMHPDSTFAILDNIDRENLQDEECCRLYDLAWAEAYYIKNKNVPDSINAVLSRINFKPDTRYSLTKDILQAIHIYNRGDSKEAFSCFEACRRKSDSKVHPYWNVVIESYMGAHCLKFGRMDLCRAHFYKLLDYARLTGDKNAIANAYSHLSAYYRSTESLDSAIIYASYAIKNCDPQNTRMLSVAYNNMASILMAFPTKDYSNVANILLMSDKLKAGTYKSMNTYSMLARLYYLLDKHDSAYIYQAEVEQGDHIYAKYNLYKFLYAHYQQSENTDSAHKYLQLYHSIGSTLSEDKSGEAILNIVHENNLRDVRQNSNLKQALTIIIAFVLCSLVIIGVSFRHRAKITGIFNSSRQILAKQKQEVADIRQENRNLNKELDSMRGRMENREAELQISNAALSDVTRQVKRYKSLVDKKNSKLAQISHKLEKSEEAMKLHSNVVIQHLLDKSVPLETTLSKAQRESCILSYAESSDERGHLVKSLRNTAPELSPTGFFICLLYNEGFSDKEIMTKLQLTPKNFSSSKSKARKIIQVKDSALIRHLLRMFDANKDSK